MAMIMAGDFRKGVTVEIDGQVWSIADFQHVKPGKGAAFVRTRLKNVMTGAVLVFAEALIPVAVGLYSSMLLAPALHVPVKAHFDKLKKKHARYEGKKKASKADAEA